MKRIVYLLVLSLLLPTAALAQDTSHWGVAASFVPEWTVPSNFKILFDAEEVDVRGTDFSIGIARGRTLGGDWNLSYIRRTLKEGSTTSDVSVECGFFSNGCFQDGTVRTVRNATLSGIQAVKFINFATIKGRVQIGMNLGGGVGTLEGELEEREFSAEFVSSSNAGSIGRQREEVSIVPAKELFMLSTVPLGIVEIAAGVILAPGVKLRVAGGLNFPGSSKFSVTGVYLIGAN
jgi:hypothetical protein